MTAAAPATIQAFLEPKAQGFIKFIESHGPDNTLREKLKGYAPDTIIPTITTYVVPSYAVGGLGALASTILEHLSPTAPREEVLARIERYLNCFAEAITSS